MKLFLDEDVSRIDLDALKYLTGECNYGGRVTDDRDRRVIKYILMDFYCDKMVADEGYKFTENSVYKIGWDLAEHNSIVDFIKQFPNITRPEVFGLHSNADITKDIAICFSTLF